MCLCVFACVCACDKLVQTSDDGALTSQWDESCSTSPQTVPLHPPNAHTHTHTHIKVQTVQRRTHTSATCHSATDLLFLRSQAAHATSHPSRATAAPHSSTHTLALFAQMFCEMYKVGLMSCPATLCLLITNCLSTLMLRKSCFFCRLRCTVYLTL